MVSRYLLIKEYNHAYSYWLRAELKKRRILGDREYSWKEAQFIIMDMKSRGERDDFFQKYFSAWGDHPDYAPDYFHLLGMVLPIYRDGEPDLAVIASLDAEARTRGQKILFTVEDAAKDFDDFYEMFLTKPLARDLQIGADGKKLREYFEYEEFSKIHGNGINGHEKIENTTQDIANRLLDRFSAITPKKILNDMTSTLDEHHRKGLAEASPEKSYSHQSDYVHVSVLKSDGVDKPAKTFIRPARLYGVIKEGYEGVHYPTYLVLDHD
jgi:hypothetical protein